MTFQRKTVRVGQVFVDAWAYLSVSNGIVNYLDFCMSEMFDIDEKYT